MPLNSLRRLPPNTPAAAVGYGAHNPIGTTGAITDTATVLEQTGLKLHANTVTGALQPARAVEKPHLLELPPAGRAACSSAARAAAIPEARYMLTSATKPIWSAMTSAGGPSCQPDTQAYDTEVFPTGGG